MKRKLKKELRAAFDAPEPQRKKAFLKNMGRPGISGRQFLLTQASYIRKWVWAVSCAVFIIALSCGHLRDWNEIWIFSALMPFLAVTAITEIICSEVYGMAELEMAARFPLRSVVLARMGILGVVHLAVLVVIALFEVREGGIGLLRTGVYLLVPYLMTDALGLWISGKIHGREAVYGIFGVAVIIGTLPVLGRYAVQYELYAAEAFIWWVAALVMVCAAAVTEWKKEIERTEELVWNLR